MTEALPWQDVPTEPGWYWFRVNPSTVIRGPEYVLLLTGPTTLLMTGVTYDAGLYVMRDSQLKLAAHFQRSWAGPLPRPVDDVPTILEDDATRGKRRAHPQPPGAASGEG